MPYPHTIHPVVAHALELFDNLEIHSREDDEEELTPSERFKQMMESVAVDGLDVVIKDVESFADDLLLWHRVTEISFSLGDDYGFFQEFTVRLEYHPPGEWTTLANADATYHLLKELWIVEEGEDNPFITQWDDDDDDDDDDGSIVIVPIIIENSHYDLHKGSVYDPVSFAYVGDFEYANPEDDMPTIVFDERNDIDDTTTQQELWRFNDISSVIDFDTDGS